MKFLSILLVVAMVACSTKASKDPVDTTAVVQGDTTTIPQEAVQFISEPDPVSDLSSDDTTQSSFLECLEAMATELETQSVYKLSVSFSGYENSSDATYYFDSLYNLLYSETSWSMEGTSGTYVSYFQNDLLAASREINSYNTYDEEVILCPHDGLYGDRTVSGDGDAAFQNPTIDNDYFKSKQAEVINEFNRIKDRVSEYANEATKESEVTKIRIENSINYGQDYLETETFEIDTPLFEALF